MAQKSALLIGSVTHIRKEWNDCSSLLKLHEYPDGNREDFLSKLKNGDYEGLFVIYRSNDSTSITGPFDKKLISALPSSLKYICHNGAGYDNIDIPSCTDRGIQVSSTPVAVNDATADIAMFLMLGALRRITPAFNAVQQGAYIFLSKLPRPLYMVYIYTDWKIQVNGAAPISASATTRRTRSSAS